MLRRDHERLRRRYERIARAVGRRGFHIHPPVRPEGEAPAAPAGNPGGGDEDAGASLVFPSVSDRSPVAVPDVPAQET